MQENFISAKECISNFKEMGIKMTEPNFSKYKKKVFFRVYRIEDSKRDYFIWGEVLESYFRLTIPRDEKEDKIRSAYFQIKKKEKKRQELFDNVSLEWGKLENHKKLTFEMFDIKNLWIYAAENLKELKEKEVKGETISDIDKDWILKEAAKTQKEHIEEFKREIFIDNETNSDLRWFIDALFDDLEKIYPSFGESRIQLDILKSANEWITTPEKTAELSAVDLIDSER